MTKPSRSKKSQPEFDPSELGDLIFTPAVGSGVGSHLLTTVQRSVSSTVDTSGQITETEPDLDLTRVAEKASVDLSEMTTVAANATVVETPTVAEEATVVRSEVSIWVTEDGQLVPRSRVKRIRLAQDVLNSAEESIYDALWTTKTALREELDSVRIVQAGYDYLMKKTRVSKKTVQRIIDRLIDKDFIAIERPADIYQRSATVYRVFGYRMVLERQAAKG